jgi:hypothetical protein
VTRINSTFAGGEPTWANACVGENGSPGYWDYARGYSRAENLLIDQVLLNRGQDYSVDEFVYPVCFNMRHSVELRLKGAITQLQIIEEIRGERLEFDLSGSHDIGLIWEFFCRRSKSIDSRYDEPNSALEPRIMDISDVDATGQTFRYPISMESKRHLIDVALINFVNLRKQFNALESDLEGLHRLNIYLIEEYAQGSFTKNLPRNRLFRLANSLPRRSNWSDDSFASLKAGIKETLGISGRELSCGIKIIESHFEFAPLIGVEPPLLGTTEDDIDRFLTQWLRLHEIPSDSEPVTVEFSSASYSSLFKYIVARAKIKEDVWDSLSGTLTPEILAGLTTLFYFGRELDFSERYKAIYERQLKNAELAFSKTQSAVKGEIFHILEKTSYMHNIS